MFVHLTVMHVLIVGSLMVWYVERKIKAYVAYYNIYNNMDKWCAHFYGCFVHPHFSLFGLLVGAVLIFLNFL